MLNTRGSIMKDVVIGIANKDKKINDKKSKKKAV